MTLKSFKIYLVWLFVLLFAVSIAASEKDPITGQEFDAFLNLQNTELQNVLASIISEANGYHVTGPMDTRISHDKNIIRLYNSIRIICPDLEMLDTALSILKESSFLKIKKEKVYLKKTKSKKPAGYRGVLLDIEWNNTEITVQLNTIHQTRWLIWAKRAFFSNELKIDKTINKYLRAVSDYLYAVDNEHLDYEEPKAVDFNLPEKYDFYAPPPDYVISGYKNYMDFLFSYREIKVDFAHGIQAFIPTDSLLDAIITNAPEKAYPNKEAPMLPFEYRKFYNREGDIKSVQTLTSDGFDTLRAGEYFFAVGINGKIRFGRELLRTEVDRIEKETGKKVPRANHAFLFPGEPILTAGAFFIEKDIYDNKPRLVRVTAQSGHYFYSNISSTIREDISENSNSYLFSLGHFLKALNELGIGYNNILISKF